ncbi:E3 ubiquitin-protein ligase RNF146 isoform X2 [Aricia agestis]|uniref:E3 ubiquitin-protein ligase RNF146 isoform X2 n=1 Tax=Aricia agestis TaxID=91739 RepID=UPI001C20C1A3|nr:E3 ubiquitin-protein ligase RNF146 isoform X2 [Aricia agestis]
MDSDSPDLDCAICREKCHHPTKLPCGHIFCFLCVKGIAIQSRKCALCRNHIPSDYLDNPVLLEKSNAEAFAIENDGDSYQWYYEGRNGWWKYDERSNSELEASYNAGETECSLLLAGTTYSIDFQNMIQVRRSDRTRRRKVRRDVPTLPAKGIAGIKQISVGNDENEENSEDVNSNSVDNETEEIEIVGENYVADNTDSPQSADDVIDLTQSVSNINIEDDARRDAPR